MRADGLPALKERLYAVVDGTQRGLTILNDAARTAEVQTVIADVERGNPTDRPIFSELCAGTWELLYTDSPETLGASRPALLRSDRSEQTISMEVDNGEDGERTDTGGIDDGGAFSIIESGSVRILPGLAIPWRNVIVGVCKPVTSKELRALGKRLSIRFDSMKMLGVFPVKFPSGVVGWQDHSFLDEDLRIIHSNRGNVAVMRRAAASD